MHGHANVLIKVCMLCRTQAEFAAWARDAAMQYGYSVALRVLGHACLEEECGIPGPPPAGATQVASSSASRARQLLGHEICRLFR